MVVSRVLRFGTIKVRIPLREDIQRKYVPCQRALNRSWVHFENGDPAVPWRIRLSFMQPICSQAKLIWKLGLIPTIKSELSMWSTNTGKYKQAWHPNSFSELRCSGIHIQPPCKNYWQIPIWLCDHNWYQISIGVVLNYLGVDNTALVEIISATLKWV